MLRAGLGDALPRPGHPRASAERLRLAASSDTVTSIVLDPVAPSGRRGPGRSSRYICSPSVDVDIAHEE